MCQCQSVNSVPHAPVSLPMSDPDDDGKVAPQLTQLTHSLSFSLCSTFTGTVMRAWSRVPAERQEHQRATNSVHSWSWTCHVTSQLVSTWPASAPAACLVIVTYLLPYAACHKNTNKTQCYSGSSSISIRSLLEAKLKNFIKYQTISYVVSDG